jgi:hypothetical protein
LEYFIKSDTALSVKYDVIPNGLVPEFNGVIYYLQTNFANTVEDHKEAIEPIISRLIDDNDNDYTSWEETKREVLVWSPVSQVTVISFRVRDVY